MAFRSVPRRFYDQAKVQPDAQAYAVRRAGAWVTTDWRTYTHEVTRLAAALIGLGMRAGDRIAIMGANAPSWTLADLASMTAGCVPVGVYTNCTAPQAGYIIRHAGARIVFVDTLETYAKVDEERGTLTEMEHVVFFREHEGPVPPGSMSWETFLARGESVEDARVEERMEAIQADDLGVLIYTSGTTGPPKGSMLTHGNMAVASDLGRELLPGSLLGARHLSYLPLAHAAERALTLLGPASFGYAVYYAESMEQMAVNLRDVRPDLFLGVPRVWEKIHDGVTGKLAQVTGARGRMIRWARGIALRVNEGRCLGREPKGRLAWKYGWARRLVLDKLRRMIGLDRATILLSGAAPLDADILKDLASLDLPIREVYGQTEDCGPTTNNRPGETRWGSVGRPFRGTEVRIGDDGEILVRGGHVFAGYFRDEDASAAVLRDGWLHSGDLGSFDADGFLHITGRKKEILITAGGKNIAPRNLEEALKRSPLIEEAIVIGDRRKYLSALVTVSRDYAEKLGGTDAEPGHTYKSRAVKDALWAHVSDINAEVSPAEQIKRIGVLPASFTVDTGELTPTLKVRRSEVLSKYAHLVEALYAPDADSSVIS